MFREILLKLVDLLEYIAMCTIGALGYAGAGSPAREMGALDFTVGCAGLAGALFLGVFVLRLLKRGFLRIFLRRD